MQPPLFTIVSVLSVNLLEDNLSIFRETGSVDLGSSAVEAQSQFQFTKGYKDINLMLFPTTMSSHQNQWTLFGIKAMHHFSESQF